MKKLILFSLALSIASSVLGQLTDGVNAKEKENLKIQDIDGNSYNIIQIGKQIWMAENLRTTKYVDGSEISLVSDDLVWSCLTKGAYCWYYNDSETYKNTYGNIYNWYSVVDQRKVCPNGWHIPADSEWTILVSYLDGARLAGGKLKENNTLHWIEPNSGATNESGFRALPGGDRHDNGPFYDLGYYCYWWSCTEKDSTKAWMYEITNGSSNINRGNFSKNDGFYVRCVRD